MTDYTKYTNEQIDRLIAEKAMGWRNVLGYWADDDDNVIEDNKYHPSTDLNQAVECANKHYGWLITKHGRAEIHRELKPAIIAHCEGNPARAICIALLEAEEQK